MWRSKPKIRTAVTTWHRKAMLVDPRKTKIIMSWTTVTPEANENIENLQIEKVDSVRQNSKIAESSSTPNVACNMESLFTENTYENLITETVMEIPETPDLVEEVTTASIIEVPEPLAPEPSTEYELSEVKEETIQPDLTQTTTWEEKQTYDMVFTDPEPANLKLLRAVEKTRILWENQKQYAKIVKKMQKGKNLKRKEFDKVHFYIREYLQYR